MHDNTHTHKTQHTPWGCFYYYMNMYISYVYAIRRRRTLFVDAHVEVPKKYITSQETSKIANIKTHGFTVQIWWLTLHSLFSPRRSGDSKLTFLTGCEMGGMTQKNTWLHFQGWSGLTLRFPFPASAVFFHNWLELFECDGTLAFASWKRSQKFQPC